MLIYITNPKALLWNGCSNTEVCISLGPLVLLWNRSSNIEALNITNLMVLQRNKCNTDTATHLICQENTKGRDKAKLVFPEVRLSIRLGLGVVTLKGHRITRRSRQYHNTQPCSVNCIYSHSFHQLQVKRETLLWHTGAERMTGHLEMKAE